MGFLAGRADLHTHTNASDGSQTPSEVVRAAADLGLSAVAITDHDTVAGLEEALEQGRKSGVVVVPGVEINTEQGGHEIHILGYYVDRHAPELAAKLQWLLGGRERRAARIVARLREIGVTISLDHVMELAAGAAVGRPHVARALAEAGWVRNMAEAFDQFIGLGAPAYVPREWLSPTEAADVILAAGGAPVLAHPGTAGDAGDLIPRLLEHGLVGIEVFYPEHGEEAERLFRRIAEENGLIMTGGSDSHGSGFAFRSGLGQRTCPFETVTLLEAAARKGRVTRAARAARAAGGAGAAGGATRDDRP